MIDLRVLGTLTVHPLNGGEPTAAVTQPKRLALLLYLALAEPSGPHSRDSLMALLWPEADDDSTRHALRNTLYGLRQALGEGAIVSRGGGYVELDPTAVRCDALEVRALLAAHRWKEALAGWGGDLAPGFHVSGAPEFERWLDEQRAALRRAVAEAGWRRVDEMERSGEPDIAEAARRAWAIDPTNEAGARRLMQLLEATTGRAAALRAYDDLADYLRREYEAVPSAETRADAAQLRSRIQGPPASSTHGAAGSVATAIPTRIADAAVTAPPTRPQPRLKQRLLVATALLLAAVGSVVALRSPWLGGSVSASGVEGKATRLGALQLPTRYRADTGAYGSYLRGLSLRFQGRHRAALDTFAALVARAPQYPPGLAGLAHSYGFAVLAGFTPPNEGMPKAEEAARRAIALDSTLASAYLSLGGVEMFWRWNLPLAGQLIDKALALDPSDAEGHAVRSAWFRWGEQLDSSLAESRMAHDLDPLNASFSERVGRQLYFLRRYAEAEAVYKRDLRDYPGRAPGSGLVAVYRAEGRTREALDILRAGTALRGDSAAAARIPVATSDTQAARMFVEMAREQLQRLAESTRRGDLVSPSDWVYAYADLGDAGEAIRWMDSMRVGRDPMLWILPIDPALDAIRKDPRYPELEAQLPWRHASR